MSSGPRWDPQTQWWYFEAPNIHGQMDWFPYPYDGSNQESQLSPQYGSQPTATDASQSYTFPRTLLMSPAQVNQHAQYQVSYGPPHQPPTGVASSLGNNLASPPQNIGSSEYQYPNVSQQGQTIGEDLALNLSRLNVQNYTFESRNDAPTSLPSSSAMLLAGQEPAAPSSASETKNMNVRGMSDVDRPGAGGIGYIPEGKGKGKAVDELQLQLHLLPRNALNIAKDTLSKDYKVRNRDYKTFFCQGRVLETLLVEPYSETTNQKQTSPHVTLVHYGQKVYCKPRILVVVRQYDEYSTCLPVTSFGGRGHKPNSKSDNLGRIYSRETDSNSHDGMMKKPVKVNLSSGNRIEITPKSCIDYARTQTVQHNWRVKDIGKLDIASLKRVLRYFKDTVFPSEDEASDSAANIQLPDQAIMGATGGAPTPAPTLAPAFISQSPGGSSRAIHNRSSYFPAALSSQPVYSHFNTTLPSTVNPTSSQATGSNYAGLSSSRITHDPNNASQLGDFMPTTSLNAADRQLAPSLQYYPTPNSNLSLDADGQKTPMAPGPSSAYSSNLFQVPPIAHSISAGSEVYPAAIGSENLLPETAVPDENADVDPSNPLVNDIILPNLEEAQQEKAAKQRRLGTTAFVSPSQTSTRGGNPSNSKSSISSGSNKGRENHGRERKRDERHKGKH